MSKFLDLIESAVPPTMEEIDIKTAAKRKLQGLIQRPLRDVNIKLDVKTFKDEMVFTLPDGQIIEVEIKRVYNKPGEEEAEDPYYVTKEVENLASQAASGLRGLAARGLGTAAQTAKSAVKQRAALAKQAVDVYKKDTDSLSRAIRDRLSQPSSFSVV